jgi:zinc transport system substrate-binding protein
MHERSGTQILDLKELIIYYHFYSENAKYQEFKMNNLFLTWTLIKRIVFPVFFLVCATGIYLLANTGHAFENQINIMVSIPPQKYFVEKIGGEYVNVSVLLPPETSPHFFEPKPARMIELGKADMYMAIGVEYEKHLLPRIRSMHPGLSIIQTDHGIKKIFMESHGHAHDHSPGDSHEHEHEHHGGKDPHIWLSPELVMIQAENIYNALASAFPESKKYFQDNYNSFTRELQDLDEEIRNIFSQMNPGTKFMVFHPAWGYFAKAYDLIQVPVEMEGKEPRAADLKHLIDTARDENIKVVFVSPQFSRRSAQVIAESIGGEIVSIDPLAEDWKQNMRKMAEKFRLANE